MSNASPHLTAMTQAAIRWEVFSPPMPANLTQASVVDDVIAPLLERAVEAAVLSAICLGALVGNLSLWYIVCSDRTLRSPSNALVLSLSSADILVSAVSLPVNVYTIAKGYWEMSERACVAFGFLSLVTFIASVLSLGVISVNRYVLICHPHRFRVVYSNWNTAFFILGTWLTSVLLALPPLLGWGKYAFIPNESICFGDWMASVSYTCFLVVIGFGGTCSVMSVCYIYIAKNIRASRRRLEGRRLRHRTQEQGQSPSEDREQRQGKSPCNADGNPSPETSNEKDKQDVDDLCANSQPISNATALLDVKTDRSSSESKKSELFEMESDSAENRRRARKYLANSSVNDKKRKRRKENVRLAISFLAVIFAFVICWLPYSALKVFSAFSNNPLPRLPNIITLFLGFFNSACNPIIYGALNQRFRAGFRQFYTAPYRYWNPPGLLQIR